VRPWGGWPKRCCSERKTREETGALGKKQKKITLKKDTQKKESQRFVPGPSGGGDRAWVRAVHSNPNRGDLKGGEIPVVEWGGSGGKKTNTKGP